LRKSVAYEQFLNLPAACGLAGRSGVENDAEDLDYVNLLNAGNNATMGFGSLFTWLSSTFYSTPCSCLYTISVTRDVSVEH